MDQNQSVGKRAKKSTPVEDHRRQMLVQVWLPLAASIIIVLAVLVLTILGAVYGNPLVNKWGSISAIYCIIPVLFTGIILMALTGGGVYGLSVLLKKIPGWFIIIHMYVIRAALLIRRILDTITKPIVMVNQFSARVGVVKKQVIH